MTTAQTLYVNKVNRIRNGDEPICKCTICDEEMFYGDAVYRIEGESICDGCIDDFIKENYKFKLGDADIAEPDWDEEI